MGFEIAFCSFFLSIVYIGFVWSKEDHINARTPRRNTYTNRY